MRRLDIHKLPAKQLARAFDVIVVGAGPAGSFAAKRMTTLGLSVALVNRPRRFAAIEGIAARAVETLRVFDCEAALDSLQGEVRRLAAWNGDLARANSEQIVDRGRFDAALREDAARAGALLLDGRVRRLHLGEHGCRVAIDGAGGDLPELRAAFVVEARGRAAPLHGSLRRRGPPATSLARAWLLAADVPRMTAVVPFADGWAWFASGAKHRGVLQLVVSSRKGALPARAELERFYMRSVRRLGELQPWLRGAAPAGAVSARGAGAVLTSDGAAGRVLRIGDAAATIDPLSGHGIFEALGSALSASPVVRTILQRPADAALARAFHAERTTTGFWRHARVGRDFYALESRWRNASFWRERSSWPDEQAAHVSAAACPPSIALRPIIRDDMVVLERVVVTADHPRGVWQVANVPLVALLDLVRSQGLDMRSAAQQLQAPLPAVRTARDWLRSRHLLAGS